MIRIVILLAATLFTFTIRTAAAQDGDALFDQNCSICHTIGGPASGDAPDLKGVTSRLDRAWIVKFVLDPEGVTKSGDAYAVDLAKKYGDTVMPPPEGLTPASVEAILTYIDQRSAGTHPPSAPASAAPAQPMQPFTSDEVARGRDLYAGRAPLARNGPACVSCHDVGAADLAGGSLGPSFIGVIDRLNGVKGLSLWLSAPPTPVMRSLYRGAPLAADEVRAVAAFIDSRRAETPQTSARTVARLAASGLAFTLAALAAIGVVWRHRFRAVRRPHVALVAYGAAGTRRLERRYPFRSGGLR